MTPANFILLGPPNQLLLSSLEPTLVFDRDRDVEH